MVYFVEGHYVISSGGLWLPGVYMTRAAAYFAFQFPSRTLARLTKRICRGQGAITIDDLKNERRSERVWCPTTFRYVYSKKDLGNMSIKEVGEDELWDAMSQWEYNPVHYYPDDFQIMDGEEGCDGIFRYILNKV